MASDSVLYVPPTVHVFFQCAQLDALYPNRKLCCHIISIEADSRRLSTFRAMVEILWGGGVVAHAIQLLPTLLMPSPLRPRCVHVFVDFV